MLPLVSSSTPEPVPRPGPGWGYGGALAAEVEEALEELAHVGLAAAAAAGLCPSRCATRGSSTSTSRRTTLGRSALATPENARDSERASGGACIFGVTAGAAAAADGCGCNVHSAPAPIAIPATRTAT